jgi:hypothetical protein
MPVNFDGLQSVQRPLHSIGWEANGGKVVMAQL